MTEDPYTLGETDHHTFWADEVADRIEARRERIGGDGPVVIKGGVSPSGVPHLGHANELMRGYFVAEVLRERGHEVRQVFTSDDRDPLRKIPRTLADREWNVMDLGDVPNPGVLGRNLGKPLTDIPDPFGCCESFGDHQTHLLKSMTEQLGIDVRIRSTTALYETGEFDAVTRELLDEHEHAHELLGEYQASVRETDEYVPFNPICAECGKLTETVTAIDGERVAYRCTDFEAGNQLIEGCGHEGTATIREGKLPWRFEWPAQWRVLTVDFEPFGKDHAEGSWPSGEAIAEELLDFTPPTPMVYEWFTLNGEPLSSSSGHIITVAELLDLLEREVLHYYFTKNPARARDFDVSRLDQLVDEFDRFERAYFDELSIHAVEKEFSGERVERVYPLIISSVKSSSYSGRTRREEWDRRRKYEKIKLNISIASSVKFQASIQYGEYYFDSDTYLWIDSNSSDISKGGTQMMNTQIRLQPRLSPWNMIEVAEKNINTRYMWNRESVENTRTRLVKELFGEHSRLPYTFAAVLGMTDDQRLREEMARREQHITANTPEWVVESALERVNRARQWAERTDNAYNYRLATDLPDVDFDDDTEKALDHLAEAINESKVNGEIMQSLIFKIGRNNEYDLDPGDLFTAGYRLFFDTEQGPKLGPFLAELDREFVVRRLRREG